VDRYSRYCNCFFFDRLTIDLVNTSGIQAVVVQSQIVQKQGQGQNTLFDRKIDLITAGLQPFLNRCLQDENQVSRANALTIYNYIMAMKTEINLSENYRRTTIVLLIRLSRFLQNKSFNLTSRDDILEFLDRLMYRI
jgi:hypothetical protein